MSMAKFYPHKQTILIALICILAVGGTLLYVQDKKSKVFAINRQINQVQDEIYNTDTIEISTSTDWKKQFFVEPPVNTDKARLKAETKPSAPLTATEKFGKDFFEQFMILKQNNLTENSEAVNNFVTKTTGELVASSPQAKTYSLVDTLVSPNTDNVSIRNYANTVGSILSKHMVPGDAALIATQALQANNEKMIKKIDPLIKAYSNILKDLLLVRVPKPYSQLHLNLINAVSAMHFGSVGMTKVFSDPIQSLAALATYENTVGNLRDSLLAYKYEFSLSNIEFSASEPAGVFYIIQ